MEETQQLLEEYFKTLHPVVQNAITSAAVEEHLRKLANTHHLHLDTWDALENEVMLALMGIKPFDAFEQNIRARLNLSTDVARALATDISAKVFQPIRDEMERSLDYPDTVAKEGTPIEDMTQEIMRAAKADPAIDTIAPADEDLPGSPLSTPKIPPVLLPATPVAPAPAPAPPPPQKPTVTRTEVPETYKPGTTSAARKDTRTDPYRLPPDA